MIRGRKVSTSFLAHASLCLTVFLFSTSGSLHAQLVQLSGGSSSLMETQGGTIQVDSENMRGAFGLGWHDGLRTGFLAETALGNGKVSVGDQVVPFVLPTDLFNSSYYLWGRGVGLRRDIADGSLFLFSGATSESLNTPFVNTASPNHAVNLFFLRHSLGSRLRFNSFNLVSGKLTTIQSIEWTPVHDLVVAASGGIGYQAPYGAVSTRLHRNKLDLLASYTLTDDQFRRIRLVSPLVTETQRGNIRVDYRPWRAGGISATHQDLLAPLLDGTALGARVDGVNAWFTRLGFR